MKNKIISGVMLLMAVVFSIGCSNDEDYSISTSAVISSITTDDAAVTAISATTYGTIQDLSGLASSSYQVGSVYSTSADPTVGGTRQIGFIDENGKVTAVLSGLAEGTTYYYATFVTLQGKVTKYGDVGLSVLWTKCNIGAEKESETGILVGFGDQSFYNASTSNDDYSKTMKVAVEGISSGFMQRACKLAIRSVRIPAAWVMGHIVDGEEGMTIDAAWMARVKEIVDYCVKDGLYVLLNDHWDGGWIQGTFKKDITEPTVQANCEKMKRLWTQIAEAFKDYDEHLLFAGLNEPEAETEAQIKVLMTYEQAFIDAVRATGGNNASRALVVQGPNTSIELSSKYVDMSKFVDTASKALMIEVHYYSPPQFTGVWEGPNGDEPFYFWGAANHVPSGTYKKYNCTWGEEAYVREQMQMMKEAFVDKGYPVILGEYGANWREFSNSSIQKKHDASIRLFHRTINEEAIKRGIIPYVWDINNPNRYGTGGIMCIIDRSKPAVFDQNSLDGIMEGAAAAAWGGPTASIRPTAFTNPQSAGQYYTLTGLRVAAGTKGLLIMGGKKKIFK